MIHYSLIINDFAEYLQVVGYNKHTQKMLYSAAYRFLEHLEEQGIEDLEALEREDIAHWQRQLENRPNLRRAGALSSSTIRGYLWAIQLLLEQEMQRGRLSRNLMSAYALPKAQQQPREILSREEVSALYEACDNLKERLVLHLHYALGLRRSEAEQLDIEDIDLGKGWLEVKKGKYGKGRSLPLTTQLESDFERYLREERPPSADKALLLNQMGRRQSGSNNLRILKSLVSRTSIHKNIDLHCLRHSIATQLIERGLDIEKLRLWLGHSQLESTKTYIHYDATRIFDPTLPPPKC